MCRATASRSQHPWLPALWLAIALVARGQIAAGYGPQAAEVPAPGESLATDAGQFAQGAFHEAPRDPAVVKASLWQPQPPMLPRLEFAPEVPLPPAAGALSANLFGVGRIGQAVLGRQSWRPGGPGADVVLGMEAVTRVTTDAGNLLGKSPAALGIGVQRRTPIVNDPRIRGSRVGQLAAAGSYWVPARADLDTMLSKIDSRILRDIIVVKGPYSVLYGPGFDFVQFELLESPRYEGGYQLHGSTSFDYKTNGDQWYGRQSLWGGRENYGFRFGYGHCTGNDYVTGDGGGIPSSYNSRDIDFALGMDLPGDRSLEVNYLRLDQTDVEFPGMVFDMDYLVTDGFEARYVVTNRRSFDRFAVDAWYNNTRFYGNAQSPGKRRQFPYLDFVQYVGYTDVDSVSSGFRAAMTWGDADSANLTAGADLRYVRQQLDEIASGRIGFTIWQDANSPIPRSQVTNPGIFLEQVLPVNDRLTLTGGARVDWATSQVIDDPQKLSHLGNWPRPQQSSLADILGTGEFDQSFTLWAVYLTGEYELSPYWKFLVAGGHGQRPPSLTELYAAQPFLLLLQNGLNSVTGDPRLQPERLWQLDLGLKCEARRFRGGITGFYSWMHDYITFENLRIVRGPPAAQVEQVNLKYVNTERATMAGFELHGQYELTSWLTPFATLQYVEGRDHTRNGEFATERAEPGDPSTRDYTRPRGAFSGVPGAPAEPLFGIPPLESRLGLLLHAPSRRPHWSLELSARVVADQNRVATSLLESPTPGFTVWDLRGYWQPSDRLLLVAGFENFTDRTYREHLDFRSPSGIAVFQPGMSFYFGSELTY